MGTGPGPHHRGQACLPWCWEGGAGAAPWLLGLTPLYRQLFLCSSSHSRTPAQRVLVPGPAPCHCSPTRDQAEGTPCSSSSSGTSGQLYLKMAGISSLRTGTPALSSAECPGPGTVPATSQALSTHYHLHLEDEKAKRIPQASIWRDGDSDGGFTWHIVQPQNTTIHRQDTLERHRRRPWGLKNFTEDLLCARH